MATLTGSDAACHRGGGDVVLSAQASRRGSTLEMYDGTAGRAHAESVTAANATGARPQPGVDQGIDTPAWPVTSASMPSQPPKPACPPSSVPSGATTAMLGKLMPLSRPSQSGSMA